MTTPTSRTPRPAHAITPDASAPAITIAAARYFAGDKAAFTHHIAVPTIRRLRHEFDVDPDLLWLERHWLNGPYVGIAICDAAGRGTAESVVTRAAALLRTGLDSHPSSDAESTEQLLARARTAGPIEGIAGPYTPIHPDNSVDVIRPGRSHLVTSWGSASALALRDRLLASALELVDLVCARHAEQPSSRVRTAVTMMALHATSYSPGATGGAMSFLSHLEDFLHRQPDAVRARFEAAWTEHASDLTRSVGDLLAGVVRTDLEGSAHAWSHAAVARARTAYRAGLVPLLPPPSGRRADSELSAFHRWVPQHFDPHTVAMDFGPYRCATNVLYTVLVLTDVRPIERYLAAYLLSRAVTRLTGVDWVATATHEARSRDAHEPSTDIHAKEAS